MFSRNSTTQVKSLTSQVVKSSTTIISPEKRALLLKKLHNAKLKQILKNSQRFHAFQRSNEWRQLNSKRYFAEGAAKTEEQKAEEVAKTEEQKPAEAPKTEEVVADAVEENATEEKTGEEKTEKKVEDKLPENNEKVTSEATSYDFQAETRKLLDIVARSLYTDKEVFIRELISNASDGLEKLRHKQVLNEEIQDKDIPLEINIYVDANAKSIIIQDSGIGMTKEELIKNLGSIGFSGSLDYIKNAKDKDPSSIIGQFGVGFYSSFMVGNKVVVYSKSSIPGNKGFAWTYDGTGNYKIAEADNVTRGTKIVIDLNKDSESFSVKETVDKIIKKYSSFVGFPIKLNGNIVNTMKPLWLLSKAEVKESDHVTFYQYLGHSFDKPSYYLHYSTDSPINIRAVFYIPGNNYEKFGAPRQDPGVSLYCRKVLIQSKAKGLLPEWMRFVKGIVDSEDIPLNLSREHLQDSALISRLSSVLTKRVLKWIEEESHKDVEKYNKFYGEFSDFLREGAFAETNLREDVARLLRYESNKLESGKLTSFEEYVSRADKEQKEIFFSVIPSRSLLESSPYYEPFKAKGVEVLLSFNSRFDDYVMTSLQDYKGKTLINIESAKAIEILKGKEAKEEENKPKLAGDELKEFLKWMKEALLGKVSSVKESFRLVDSPSLIVDHESAAFRKMMLLVDPQRVPELPKQPLEINPKHEVIIRLNSIRNSKPLLAQVIAEQIFDNAVVAAGLMSDPRTMLPRMNSLLLAALDRNADVIVKENPKESRMAEGLAEKEKVKAEREKEKAEREKEKVEKEKDGTAPVEEKKEKRKRKTKEEKEKEKTGKSESKEGETKAAEAPKSEEAPKAPESPAPEASQPEGEKKA